MGLGEQVERGSSGDRGLKGAYRHIGARPLTVARRKVLLKRKRD